MLHRVDHLAHAQQHVALRERALLRVLRLRSAAAPLRTLARRMLAQIFLLRRGAARVRLRSGKAGRSLLGGQKIVLALQKLEERREHSAECLAPAAPP